MLNIDLLKDIMIISLAGGCITTLTCQKFKEIIKKKKYVFCMTLLVSMIIGTLFSKCFSSANWIYSLWGGFFTWIDSQMLYSMLEDKIFKPYSKLENIEEIEREVI